MLPNILSLESEAAARYNNKYRRGQETVTCRWDFTCSCLKVLVTLLGHGDFLISIYFHYSPLTRNCKKISKNLDIKNYQNSCLLKADSWALWKENFVSSDFDEYVIISRTDV